MNIKFWMKGDGKGGLTIWMFKRVSLSYFSQDIDKLPVGSFKHCLVTLANGDLFYSGGRNGTSVIFSLMSDSSSRPNNVLLLPQATDYRKESYRYFLQNHTWIKMADMAETRTTHGCGRVINPSTGREEVVVVGAAPYMTFVRSSNVTILMVLNCNQGTTLRTNLVGDRVGTNVMYGSPLGGQINEYEVSTKWTATSEIYDVEGNTWRPGKALPQGRREMASLPYGESFFIVGGSNEDRTCSNEVVQVNAWHEKHICSCVMFDY